VGRIASELSPLAADKELDCSRMRSMPADTMRPSSESLASGDILEGQSPFGLDVSVDMETVRNNEWLATQ
jgi:hypothetical protein